MGNDFCQCSPTNKIPEYKQAYLWSCQLDAGVLGLLRSGFGMEGVVSCNGWTFIFVFFFNSGSDAVELRWLCDLMT